MYTGQAYSSPEEALQHFGVKGMKWGVRRDRGTTQRPTRRPTPESGEAPKREFTKKQKMIAAGAATVVVGGVVAAAILANKGNTKTSSLPTTHSAEVANLITKGNMAKTMGTPHSRVSNYIRSAPETQRDYRRLTSELKKNEYLFWDDRSMMYQKSKTHGYNDKTGKMGPKGYNF